MSMYYFTVPGKHYELFGHTTPVRDTEIKEAIFGYDATERWAREAKETRKDASKYISEIEVSKLLNIEINDIEQGLWASLVDSIKEQGITTPLLLMEKETNGEMKYWILEGHYRAGVAVKLKLPAVPALVIRCDHEYTSEKLG